MASSSERAALRAHSWLAQGIDLLRLDDSESHLRSGRSCQHPRNEELCDDHGPRNGVAPGQHGFSRAVGSKSCVKAQRARTGLLARSQGVGYVKMVASSLAHQALAQPPTPWLGPLLGQRLGQRLASVAAGRQWEHWHGKWAFTDRSLVLDRRFIFRRYTTRSPHTFDWILTPPQSS